MPSVAGDEALGSEDDEELGSDDDEEEHEPETENLIVCQYDKVPFEAHATV